MPIPNHIDRLFDVFDFHRRRMREKLAEGDTKAARDLLMNLSGNVDALSAFIDSVECSCDLGIECELHARWKQGGVP